MKTTYLGIEIDYSRDSLVTDFAKATLRERYYYDGVLRDCGSELDSTSVEERSPQESFARAAVFAATRKGRTDTALAQRLYDSCSLGHFGWSTPVLSNGGTTRGLPISCFLQYVPDSMEGISDHWRESAALASKGGGLGAYQGAIRTTNVATSKGSKSNGMIPFLKVSDSMMNAVSQGTTRRGAYASYLPIDHPEIKYFMNMRKNDGGDLSRKCLNLHHGVVISDRFMDIIKKSMETADYDDSWELIDPHTKAVIEVVSARELWENLLKLRAGAGKGEPYIMFGDTVRAGMPEDQRNAGLDVVQSNLCTEITLPTNEERTAVCCLSSLNLAKRDEWPEDLIMDLVTALDNVLDHFILHAAPSISTDDPEEMTFNEFSKHVLKSKKAYAKAAYSAYMERSIGLGVMGFHTALQQKGLPWASVMAAGFNHQCFRDIQAKVEFATAWLGSVRGSAPDHDPRHRYDRRNMCTTAIAPTATNSIICGGVSPGIEPVVANVYTHKTDSGNFTIVNPELIKACAVLAGDKGVDEDSFIDAVVTYAKGNEGSVKDCPLLPPDVQEVFATAYEIDQQWVVQHAADRQPYIDQAQSVNLFFKPELWASKDEYTRYFNAVHVQAWEKKLKTLYYCRTTAAKRAETKVAATKAFEVNDSECLACEG